MDPNQALKEARAACEYWACGVRSDYDLDAFYDLVRAFEALDQWLSKGGFLPLDWRSVTRCNTTLTQPVTEHTKGK